MTIIRWDKIGTTWIVDTKAGRYSVRRVAPRQKFGAFLNGKALTTITASIKLQMVKDQVEQHIRAAGDIAPTHLVRRINDGAIYYLTQLDLSWVLERKLAGEFSMSEAFAFVDNYNADDKRVAKYGNAEAVLILGDKNKVVITQKMWLANWATPEDADTLNDDRQTAIDAACPSGVVMLTYDDQSIQRVLAMALQEWNDADEEFPLGEWRVIELGEDYRTIAYGDFAHTVVLGIVVIRSATVFA